MISVLVANSKGGCGKTTVATHIAAYFASAGHETVLADADPQHSGLKWLSRRPQSAASIESLDWSESVKGVPRSTQRLVIDAAAGLHGKTMKELVKSADTIVVPVLPSAFDQETTLRFLRALKELKSIRKNRKPVAVVRNRVRSRTRAAARLDRFVLGMDQQDLGWLPDRAIFNEVAALGLTVFDVKGKQAEELLTSWRPLVRYIDEAA